MNALANGTAHALAHGPFFASDFRTVHANISEVNTPEYDLNMNMKMKNPERGAVSSNRRFRYARDRDGLDGATRFGVIA